MTVPSETIWSLDSHTIAKHEILKRYLQRWFPIVTKHHNQVIYVDGFCGPGAQILPPASPELRADVHRIADKFRDALAEMKRLGD